LTSRLLISAAPNSQSTGRQARNAASRLQARLNQNAFAHQGRRKTMTNQASIELIGWQKNGQPIETPAGINVYDYFADGRYAGPDTDGVEPIVRIAYEDGYSMTQYFTNEGSGWALIGADGVLRDIPEDGGIAEAFAEII
jgi:hypothetical protein